MKVQIQNGIPYVNGELVGWADIVVAIAGVPVTGITGIEYNDEQQVDQKYGAGRYPVGYSKGRITCTGKISACTRSARYRQTAQLPFQEERARLVRGRHWQDS